MTKDFVGRFFKWINFGKIAFMINKLNYNIARACLLNRSPVPEMDLKAIDQACDVTC